MSGKNPKITIELVDGVNTVIRLNGEWTSKNVQTVVRKLPRAYRDYQHELRRKGVGKFEPAVNQEASDDSTQ